MAHHRHLIGQPTTGKTSLMAEMLACDPTPGIIVFDTRGDLEFDAEYIIDPTHTRWNPLAETIDPELAPNFFAQTIKDAFGYDDTTTPVMSMYLSFVAATLIENRYNLTDAPKLLTDADFRFAMRHRKTLVQGFWDGFDRLSEREQRSEAASTLNKFLGLLLDGRAERMFSVNRSGLSLNSLAEKTTLVRLPLQQYGHDTVALIGSFLLAYLSQVITSPYAIYLEDAHLFAKGTLTNILTTTSNVSLTLCHQYLDQLKRHSSDTELLSAVMGNCAERFIFRVSQQDAQYLAKDLPPMSSKCSLDELENYTYRCIPYNKNNPDQRTIPLEKLH